MNNIKKYLSNLSSSSGVYIFKDASEAILYIGKAANLKSRVSSYFKNGAEGRLVERAISRIAKIEIRETDSVLEALILEANLIKKYQPKYNIELKDDKSFSYAVITKGEFPRIMILRKTDLSHIQTSSLSGKSLPAGRQGQGEGVFYSRIFGPYISKKQLEIALKIIRKIFPYHTGKQKTEKGCLDFQIGLCPGPYAGAISRKDYLKNIADVRMILGGKKKSLMKKLQKEMENYSKAREFEKAAEIRNRIFALKHIQDIALIARNDDNFPHPALSQRERGLGEEVRIEAYDISNISGQYAVGSMAVFKNDEPDKSEYRKFKIKTIHGADDVGMMREVLLRRFGNDWPLPDLILLDGGQGHLNMGASVLESLGLNIPIVTVAKGADRKNQELRIMNHGLNRNIKSILNNKNLIKQIMDEAHRFAIAYHRKVRRKNFL
ncbi:MAG: GIY-YIG nuclease family protein [bacterium]|nr:GIY-YIG nuclease family protein [bacterium]